MKYKNTGDKDLMVSMDPRQGRPTEVVRVKMGEVKDLDISEERALAQGLVHDGSKPAPKEVKAEVSEVSGGADGSMKVETKKKKAVKGKKGRR